MFSFLGGGGRGRGAAVAASFAVKRKKHRRTGRAGEGCWSPPQILGNSDFLGGTRKFGQSQFLKTSTCFYYSFEEINIFHFLLPESGVIIQLHWHETVAA